MRVLVTGHKGYIGTILVPMLQKAGSCRSGFIRSGLSTLDLPRCQERSYASGHGIAVCFGVRSRDRVSRGTNWAREHLSAGLYFRHYEISSAVNGCYWNPRSAYVSSTSALGRPAAYAK